MTNKISNVTSSDKYGKSIHFISFFCSILSRLAYMNDTTFLTNYCKIFNSQNTVIPLNILETINKNVGKNKIFKLTDLEIAGITNNSINQDELMNEINITQYAKKINVINGEVVPELGHLIDSSGNPIDISISTEDSKRVKYISIGTSNYGEIYILTDTKMPNVVLVLFRGTYSTKTAGSYLKPSSTIPLKELDDVYMKGIYKITIELMNTIIESIRYLTKDKSNMNIITTGHSLGGAMSTTFAYKWVQLSQEKRPQKVSDKITCISLGSPRIFNKETSNKFCKYTSEEDQTQKIFYLRIVTRGDPIPALPPKQLGYSHPCSSMDETYRQAVYESCNTSYNTATAILMNYDANLDCQNFERRMYVTNPFSHTNYLQIKYLLAVDISAFIKSGVSLKTTEVERNTSNNNATVCRLIYFNGTENVGEEFKVIFFDMNKARGQIFDDKKEEDEANNEKPINIEENNNDMQGGAWFWETKKEPTTQQSTTQPPTTQQSTTNTSNNRLTLSNVATSASNYGKSVISKLTNFSVPRDKNVTTEIFEKMISEMKPIQTIPTIAKLPLKSDNIFIDFPNIIEQSEIQTQSGGKRTFRRRTNNRRKNKKNKKTKRTILNKKRTNKRRR